jgi:adenylate kinase family enzyme
MRRVSVVGNSGAGKTRLARALAARLGVPHVEVDALNHQANWTPTPPDRLREEVRDRLAGDGWVVDGNYAAAGVQDVVWAYADTVVWVDPPRALVMWQVIVRSLRRALRREVLWNGNREPWSSLLSLDPERSVIAWAWVQHNRCRDRYEAARRDPAWSHLRFVRLRSRREAARLLDEPSDVTA